MKILTLRFEALDTNSWARFKTEGDGTVLLSKTVQNQIGLDLNKTDAVQVVATKEGVQVIGNPDR